MPEKTATGSLPKSIEVILHNDLVDIIKPGDRVQIYGVNKIFASSNTAQSGMFTNQLIATSFQIL